MPSTDPRVFPGARGVLDRLLADLDARAPGLVAGLHLVGSIALGNGRPGQSDIDLVLVRAEGIDNAATMAALEPALTGLRASLPGPVLDGIVLGAADLAAGPDAIAGVRPVIVENEARLEEGGGARNPVIWQTLRQCGIAYRGAINPDRLWQDPARLDAWTRENLEAYWRPWLTQIDRLVERDDLPSLIDEATEWGVLGVTRLHYTLASGQVTSKHGAGLHALEAFPEQWHPIVEEALRIRERRPERSRFGDPRETACAVRAYMAMVIDDALALPRAVYSDP